MIRNRPPVVQGAMRALFTTTLAVALAAPGLARAHDLWLIPDPRPALGQPKRVFVTQGMEFGKSDGAPDVKRLERAEVFAPDGARLALSPERPMGPAGVLSFLPERPGLYVIGAETSPKILELDAVAFNEYLVADGMPHVYRQRHKDKELDRSAVERYGKSTKALVKLGDGPGDHGRVLGHRLELVPLEDPFAKRPGDTLRVRVLFQGKPLADARVGWQHPNEGDEPNGSIRSDASGVAHVPITREGPMSIRLTHMTRPKAKDHEWESFWTTLCFTVAKPS